MKVCFNEKTQIAAFRSVRFQFFTCLYLLSTWFLYVHNDQLDISNIPQTKVLLIQMKKHFPCGQKISTFPYADCLSRSIIACSRVFLSHIFLSAFLPVHKILCLHTSHLRVLCHCCILLVCVKMLSFLFL